jgi:hypothetical protein
VETLPCFHLPRLSFEKSEINIPAVVVAVVVIVVVVVVIIVVVVVGVVVVVVVVVVVQVVFLGNGRSGKTSMLRALAKKPLLPDKLVAPTRCSSGGVWASAPLPLRPPPPS